MEAKTNIAKRLKELRKEHRLTQQQLADNTGITLKSIQNYENAVREPNSKSMAVLEKFFNVSGACLRGESSSENKNFIWEDVELMEAISAEMLPLVKHIVSISRNDSEMNQQCLFAILTELLSIMKIPSSENRDMMLELVKNNIHSINNVANRKGNKKHSALD